MNHIKENPKLVIFLSLVIIATILLAYPLILKKNGVVVTNVPDDAPCKNMIIEGSVIEEVSGIKIKNKNEFYDIAKKADGPTTLLINNNPRTCNITMGNLAKIDVDDLSQEFMKFGVDVKGGKKYIVGSKDGANLDDVLEVIQNRAKKISLTNIQIEKTGDDISILFNPNDESKVKGIIKQGIFEIKFLQLVEFKNKTGFLTINNKDFEINLIEDNTIVLEGKKYKIDDTLKIEGLDIEIKNISYNETVLFVNVFDDREIISILSEESRIVKQGNDYLYIFTVEISEYAGKNFAISTKDQEIVLDSFGESYLKNPMIIVLDDEIISSVPVLQSDSGKEIDNLVIWGSEPTRERVSYTMLKTISILEEKRLPFELEIKSMGYFSPNLMNECKNWFYILGGVLVGFLILNFVRYKNPKFILLMVISLMGEGLFLFTVMNSKIFSAIILFSSVLLFVNEKYYKIKISFLGFGLMFLLVFSLLINGWILDFMSIIGFACVLFLTIVQITIINEFISNKNVSFFKAYENILNNIWIVTSVVVALMTVLFFIDMAKGFALTIVAGLMIKMHLIKSTYAEFLKRKD